AMQAVILAAGKGTRLHPITLKRSKAMLPILGTPIVERVMGDIAANGVGEFILVASPEDEEIVDHFQQSTQLRSEVRFVHQPERRGTADALRCAAPYIAGDFILSACDNLISAAHVRQMLALWKTSPRPNAILTLMPVEPERTGSAGIVAVEGPWVTRIVEKPAPGAAPSNVASLPLYLFSRRILDFLLEIQLSARGEYELQDAIQMLIEREGRVRGETVGRRLTLTSAADLLTINLRYLSQGGPPHVAPAAVGANTRLIMPLRIESGVVIGANSTIGPNVYLERDCRVRDGVTIQDSMVLRGAVVPKGAVLNDQVVA
ncbi:MAG: sugar phosphate nucleotidyltransferase, partial [Anaerolineales bacterium]